MSGEGFSQFHFESETDRDSLLELLDNSVDVAVEKVGVRNDGKHYLVVEHEYTDTVIDYIDELNSEDQGFSYGSMYLRSISGLDF